MAAVFLSEDAWAAQIAGLADLPDDRLNHRFAQILATLAAKPLDSLPQACGSAGEAKATYRFFSNQRFTAVDLLRTFTANTVAEARGRALVLSIHDSSSLNFATLGQTTGLGPICKGKAQGLHIHTTLAVTSDGLPLGLLHQQCWARPPKVRTSSKRFRLGIADKESRKWLDGVAAASAALQQLPQTERPRLLHLMDREADIHEVLQQISDLHDGAVIRCQHNRRVAGPIGRAHQAVTAAPLRGTILMDVPAQHGQLRREAKLELRSVTLTITRSCKRAHQRQRRPVTWNLIEAREIETPTQVEPLHWLLWTTEPVGQLTDVLEVLRLYRLRWRIEDFHLTLKSGCRVEALELETAARLKKAIAIYSAVAVRILALRDLARQQPEAPCTLILNDDTWKALWLHIHKRPLPVDMPVPTIKQAILWIGRLGGHLGRKRDGMPGVRTLWRGWRDLIILVAGYQASRYLNR
jgi:hypothetical protein